MVHELLKGHFSVLIFEEEAIPKGPILAQEIGGGGLDRVWESNERQSQVGEPILEQFDL